MNYFNKNIDIYNNSSKLVRDTFIKTLMKSLNIDPNITKQKVIQLYSANELNNIMSPISANNMSDYTEYISNIANQMKINPNELFSLNPTIQRLRTIYKGLITSPNPHMIYNLVDNNDKEMLRNATSNAYMVNNVLGGHFSEVQRYTDTSTAPILPKDLMFKKFTEDILSDRFIKNEKDPKSIREYIDSFANTHSLVAHNLTDSSYMPYKHYIKAISNPVITNGDMYTQPQTANEIEVYNQAYNRSQDEHFKNHIDKTLRSGKVSEDTHPEFFLAKSGSVLRKSVTDEITALQDKILSQLHTNNTIPLTEQEQSMIDTAHTDHSAYKEFMGTNKFQSRLKEAINSGLKTSESLNLNPHNTHEMVSDIAEELIDTHLRNDDYTNIVNTHNLVDKFSHLIHPGNYPKYAKNMAEWLYPSEIKSASVFNRDMFRDSLSNAVNIVHKYNINQPVLHNTINQLNDSALSAKHELGISHFSLLKNNPTIRNAFSKFHNILNAKTQHEVDRNFNNLSKEDKYIIRTSFQHPDFKKLHPDFTSLADKHLTEPATTVLPPSDIFAPYATALLRHIHNNRDQITPTHASHADKMVNNGAAFSKFATPKPLVFSTSTENHYDLKHKIKELGGAVPYSQLKALGYNLPAMGYKINSSKDIITPETIDSHISTLPKHSFNTIDSVYHGESQNHSVEQTNHVKRLELTPEKIEQLKQVPESYELFNKINETSTQSGHPVGRWTAGWVRYSQSDDGTHIDEIQTDYSDTTMKELLANNLTTPEAINHFNKVVWGGEHPSKVLHSGFLQHLRDKNHENKPVHLWQDKSKAGIANMDVAQPLPAHMKEGYNKQPKQMGYTPSEYGKIEVQDNDELKGQPTWSKVLRKSIPVRNVGDYSHIKDSIEPKDRRTTLHNLLQQTKDPKEINYIRNEIWDAMQQDESYTSDKNYAKIYPQNPEEYDILDEQMSKPVEQINPDILNVLMYHIAQGALPLNRVPDIASHVLKELTNPSHDYYPYLPFVKDANPDYKDDIEKLTNIKPKTKYRNESLDAKVMHDIATNDKPHEAKQEQVNEHFGDHIVPIMERLIGSKDQDEFDNNYHSIAYSDKQALRAIGRVPKEYQEAIFGRVLGEGLVTNGSQYKLPDDDMFLSYRDHIQDKDIPNKDYHTNEPIRYFNGRDMYHHNEYSDLSDDHINEGIKQFNYDQGYRKGQAVREYYNSVNNIDSIVNPVIENLNNLTNTDDEPTDYITLKNNKLSPETSLAWYKTSQHRPEAGVLKLATHLLENYNTPIKSIKDLPNDVRNMAKYILKDHNPEREHPFTKDEIDSAILLFAHAIKNSGSFLHDMLKHKADTALKLKLHTPENIVYKPDGKGGEEAYINLHRNTTLPVSEMNRDVPLASYADDDDRQSLAFGKHMTSYYVPLKNVWHSYLHSSHGYDTVLPEAEYVVSPPKDKERHDIHSVMDLSGKKNDIDYVLDNAPDSEVAQKISKLTNKIPKEHMYKILSSNNIDKNTINEQHMVDLTDDDINSLKSIKAVMSNPLHSATHIIHDRFINHNDFTLQHDTKHGNTMDYEKMYDLGDDSRRQNTVHTAIKKISHLPNTERIRQAAHLAHNVEKNTSDSSLYKNSIKNKLTSHAGSDKIIDHISTIKTE